MSTITRKQAMDSLIEVERILFKISMTTDQLSWSELSIGSDAIDSVRKLTAMLSGVVPHVDPDHGRDERALDEEYDDGIPF